MDKKTLDGIKKLPFEDALAKLEKMVGKMESGNLPLEEMMKKFEEGQLLASICNEKLKIAEKKIETLKKRTEGDPQWEPYDITESQTRNAPTSNNSEQAGDDLLF